MEWKEGIKHVLLMLKLVQKGRGLVLLLLLDILFSLECCPEPSAPSAL